MKKLIFAAIAGLIILVLAGCAPVKIYSDSALTKKSGLKFYTLKPFLLVEKDLAKMYVTKTTVIYLPDLANPQYLVVKGGPGSKKADLKLNDGTIETLNMSSDTKIPETLEALAKLVPDGISALSELKSKKNESESVAASTITELYEIFIGPDGTSVKKVDFK
jgi:hypothetical protein